MFGFYVITLAKKLRECGVFGVSSDESLNHATKNQIEWENREEIVAGMVEYANSRYACPSITETQPIE